MDIYCQPYDAKMPVICMDEKSYQLLEQVRDPIPVTSSHPLREDGEYIRHGTCSIFVFPEPLTGWCHVDAKERRTSIDRAEQIRHLLEVDFPGAPKIHLVMDNLNTPKHGSWLNMAEIQISVLARQCLSHRIPTLQNLNSEIATWQTDHLLYPAKINWQCTTDDARIKLKHLYPII